MSIITAPEFGSYIIDVSNNNHTVYLVTGERDKEGKPIMTREGYYSNPRSATKKILELRQKDLYTKDEVLTMSKYIADMERIKNELLKVRIDE